MKSCLNCKFADWQKTDNGRLHRSGDGVCRYPWRMPKLPASMYWIGTPTPYGGTISRKRLLDEDCAYFNEAEP